MKPRWHIQVPLLSTPQAVADTFEIDISPSNIMLTIADESILEDFEKGEIEEPSPCKVIDDVRRVYGSRRLGLPRDALWGQPVLCDFGEARIGGPHRGLIQPEVYRAPEVLFNMQWSSSVDIWNIAVLVSVAATPNPLTGIPAKFYPPSDWGSV